MEIQEFKKTSDCQTTIRTKKRVSRSVSNIQEGLISSTKGEWHIMESGILSALDHAGQPGILLKSCSTVMPGFFLSSLINLLKEYIYIYICLIK